MRFQPSRSAKTHCWTAVIGGLVAFMLVLASKPSFETSAAKGMAVLAVKRPSSEPTSTQSLRSASAVVQAPEAEIPVPTRRDEDVDISPDLFAFSVAAANSRDPNKWAQGFAAVSECMAAKEDRDRYENAIAQAPLDPMAVKVGAAATLVMNRCRGFLNNDRIANEALRKQLTANIRAGNEYVAGVTFAPLTRKQFESVLQRNDYLTFGNSWADVVETSLRVRNLKQADTHALAFGVGYLLAQCDIGQDCSTNSLRYAQICVREARCDDSLENYYQQGLPTSFKAEISIYRQDIARAFRERDTAFFGMSSH